MTSLVRLADLPESVDGAAAWVAENLDGLFGGEPRRSGAFIGGQTAADAALEKLDIAGYARRRSQVWPEADRGASKLSPYIRHGLLSLPTVHEHPTVADAPGYDRFKYRGELLWQEYSRHWYAVYGTATREGVANEPQPSPSAGEWSLDPWPDEMECMARTTGELHADGWVVNQARMWLASQWSVRAGAPWREGEDEMFRHLVDGSRAANRLGWQWTVGGSRARAYSLARRQVLKRAPEFCEVCELRDACPISAYPGTESGPKTGASRVGDIGRWFGPIRPESGAGADPPDAVWITAESLGDADPALAAYPDLPAHFVFDEALLRSLQLDGKRLVFMTECLADLAQRRTVSAWSGSPTTLAGDVGRLAVTFAGVPGFARIVDAMTDVEIHPFPWLRPPTEAYAEHLESAKAFPAFKAFCSLTKPS